ncbi:single-stranded-DNA-specific exonuclease RecJ [Nitratifractor salsuginis]|uniref:Single-stranded-DNA-specific exonuclease RecJ n=1 Tax=Nitratifractor salsuginis (strain DSM 16511 / JCM 12458 / E9I37-1) TaxID=749222 RepID=E6WXV7_NITSE|nr:single-stranded-DNA-specific exonuclease RecJ [Nitratifractor salsuginis]ADV45278.1 single-stranded-DNA-specific exonuclease RecJ [Nitratifractor salsuginis DSM 16511]
MDFPYPRLHSLAQIEALLRERFDDTFLSLKDLPDPYAFKDMERAVERIAEAIEKGEKIVLVGDYDVDGVSSTAIMRRFFEALGVPLEWVIPNRFRDGYGLSPTLFPRLEHADLILTVDNGIAANEAAKLCKEAGIDLIITDHHIVPDTPPQAYAIVDQKQSDCGFPHREVCGAQIAWYLCAALNRRLGAGIDMKALLELTALAIIADIMPLQHINRAMVHQGLRLLERSHSPFIVAWRERNGKERLRAEDIAFGLAPLINSAGRMEDASIACDFLCAPTSQEAHKLLERLQGFNERRKGMEENIFQEAQAQIDPEAPLAIAIGEEWHEGVLGIVAARIARRFEVPALVLTRSGASYKGSGRSFGSCHLYELLATQRSLMEKFGGHAAAVGLSVSEEKLGHWKQRLQEEALSRCPRESFADPEILGEIGFDLLGWELYRLLERFEPYGEGNPRPKFITRGVSVESLRVLGSEGQHFKVLLSDGTFRQEAIQFRCSALPETGDRIDLVYTLNENRFNGRSTLQLLIDKFRNVT